MNYFHFLHIKKSIKINDNSKAPKFGEEGYNPAYKYDYAFKVIIENCNAFTKRADLDLTGDETTFGHNAYGEPKSGLVSRIIGKPHVTRGMQTVLVFDAFRNCPRAYCHRHKCHKPYPKSDKISGNGPSEV